MVRKIFFLFLILPMLSLAQVKVAGRVLDGVTKKPIPYVNFENFSAQLGTQANEHGVFELNLPMGKITDTIFVSCIGYKRLAISNLKPNHMTIELTPLVFQLSEVKISNKKPKIVEVGVLKKSGVKSNTHSFQIPGTQSAVYLANNSYEQAYLKEIFFFIGDDMYDAPFRIHIRENDKGIPGKDLIEKNIEFAANRKNAWNSFDLTVYNLLMPENGLWVSVEWIKNEKYKKVVTLNVNYPDGSKKPWSYTYYGPEILTRFDSSFGLAYRKFLGGNWTKKGGQRRGVLDKNWRDANTDLMIKGILEVY
ncbi:MAG: hypothetical protein EOO47_04550 [Flavobacterium sp.]|nr:MAG: hypothetical protein EOO47_04550 [Flavobacterium sp.]